MYPVLLMTPLIHAIVLISLSLMPAHAGSVVAGTGQSPVFAGWPIPFKPINLDLASHLSALLNSSKARTHLVEFQELRDFAALKSPAPVIDRQLLGALEERWPAG